MRFRTEIEISRCEPRKAITHDDRIVMLGSCFTDNIGEQLEMDGFEVVHNPMGPLFNPVSIFECLHRAGSGQAYSVSDFVKSPDGCYHCLDFASKYQSKDANLLADMVNYDLSDLAEECAEASVAIISLGSAIGFRFKSSYKIVGNCHKFPASDFEQVNFVYTQIGHYLAGIASAFPKARKVIFTVSPVRHLAYGLHGNNISKAHLLLAIEEVLKMNEVNEYFPAYEIVNDDLRDYRFYAPDLTHPSDTAVQYIYEQFGKRYFFPDTLKKAKEARAKAKFEAHRPILDSRD